MADTKLMFHNNNFLEEQQQVYDLFEKEGISRKQIKRTRLRKTRNRIERALKNRDWEQLEDLEGYNINVK